MDGYREHGSLASALLEAPSRYIGTQLWEVRGGFPELVTLEWGRDKKGRGIRERRQLEADTPWHCRTVPRGEGGVVGMWGRGRPVDQAGGGLDVLGFHPEGVGLG